MKSSYTRKGKSTLAGLLDDGMKSVTRFYINRFKDTDNQVAIDLFLGRIEEYIEEDVVCNQIISIQGTLDLFCWESLMINGKLGPFCAKSI